MPSVEYVPGVPMWIDLGTSDLEAAGRFYASLFGWEFQSAGPDAGGYGFFMLRGKMVAGAGPLMSEQQPVAWSTYIHSADVEATAARARQAGGTVMVEPMDVMDAGRMAFVLDSTGAAIGVWQPKSHAGAELANEPGAFAWNELATRDVEGAKAFYQAVFDWDAHTRDMGAGAMYTEFQVGGRSVAGMRAMDADYPPQVPAHWLVYFAVADADAAVSTASEQGGRVVVPPMDVEPGRLAVLSDPQGAPFAVIAMREAPVA
jgi:uncharacterized protein